jgi:tetratricopeptide (TPR) repeat protein
MYFYFGKYEKAKDYYQRGLSILKPGRILPSFIKLLEVAIVRVKVIEGDRDVDLSELVRYYKVNKFKAFQVWMARYIAEILLKIGEEYIPEAENWIKAAIDTDKRNSMNWFLARDYSLYAELLKQKGDKLNTKKNLHIAIEILNKCGADGWVEKYGKELAALS